VPEIPNPVINRPSLDAKVTLTVWLAPTRRTPRCRRASQRRIVRALERAAAVEAWGDGAAAAGAGRAGDIRRTAAAAVGAGTAAG